PGWSLRIRATSTTATLWGASGPLAGACADAFTVGRTVAATKPKIMAVLRECRTFALLACLVRVAASPRPGRSFGRGAGPPVLRGAGMTGRADSADTRDVSKD